MNLIHFLAVWVMETLPWDDTPPVKYFYKFTTPDKERNLTKFLSRKQKYR